MRHWDFASRDLTWTDRRNRAYSAWVELLDFNSRDHFLEDVAVQLKIQNLMEAERYFARRAKGNR